MQIIAPGTLATNAPLEKGDDKKVKAENIRKFLECCRQFGLNDDQLFNVEDLLSMLDLPRVTKCLYTLGKFV